jgi:N6-adenosine-specific RNA methylase IME4
MIQLELSKIRLDGGTQPRAQLNELMVIEYTDEIVNGAIFPPVVVFFDGSEYWLADGFHRYDAHRRLGLAEIEAEVKQGTVEDARWYSFGVNKSHGLRRTNEDKRRAVEAALTHPYRNKYSDNQIAQHIGVSREYISRVWGQLSCDRSQDREERIVTRNGATYTMQTTNIGKPPPRLDDPFPELPQAYFPETNGTHLPEPEPMLEQVITQMDGCKIVLGDAKRLDLTQFEQYGVIVADPPWPYRITIKQGTTEGQYETMTDEDLRAIPVPQLALPDSVLLLWGTWPKLPEALALMRAWGFDYVTGFPWVKTTSGNNFDYGVGYWVRGVSEYVMVGKRGGVSVESLRLKGFMGLLAENGNGSPELWLGGPNLQHSRKPDSVHQIAEALPGPYLELFARRPRHGWTVFGNEQALLQRTLA